MEQSIAKIKVCSKSLGVLLLSAAIWVSYPHSAHSADIAGYMEYKEKIESQQRAAEGIQDRESRAQSGDSQAQYDMGMAYRYGWGGVAVNHRDAALWFREAVDQEHPRAQFELGLMYEFGEGVPTNLKRAHMLYEKAAKQNIREARQSLALIRGKMLKVEEYIRNHHKPNYDKEGN